MIVCATISGKVVLWSLATRQPTGPPLESGTSLKGSRFFPRGRIEANVMFSADSKSLARIPFNARGLKHLGCRRNEMPFEDWVKLSKEARKASLMQWCRVEYNGQQGWVAGRFLKPDETQKQ